MILNYTEPQLNIAQVLTNEIPSVPRQSAVIVGPQYVSPGFESNFEYETFSSSGDNLALSFTDSDGVKSVDSAGLIYKLDESSLELFIKDGEFDLIGYAEDNGIAVSPGPASNQVIFPIVLRASGSGVLDSTLQGRAVTTGDVVYCATQASGGEVIRRTVTGFIGAAIPSTHGTDGDNADTLFAAGASNPTETTVGSGIYELSTESVPSNYNSEDTTLVPTSSTSINRAVNLNGLSFLDDGDILCGARLTLRITSYNSGSGTAALTSSDGVINTTVPFAYDTDLTFNLSGSTALHGIASFSAEPSNPALPPVVGSTFTFAVKTVYTPVDLASDITSGDSEFEGTDTNSFYLRVVTGSYQTGDTAVLQVYDARGTFTPFTVSIPYDNTTTTVNLGSGMEATIVTENIVDDEIYPQKGFRKNDIYFINAIPASRSTTSFTGLILDGPATTGASVAFAKLRGIANGVLNPNQVSGSSFELANDLTSVDYAADLTWFVPTRNPGFKYVPLVSDAGSVYVNWKAVKVPAETEGAKIVYSASDAAEFGPVHPENDLAFAVRTAINVLNGNSLFVLRTAGESAEDMSAALERIENTDLAYAIAPISDDPEVLSAAVAHAQEMSAVNVKNFRRVYFGAKCPAEFTLFDKDLVGATAQATLTLYDGLYRYVTFTNNVGLVSKAVRKGDFVEMAGYRLVIEQVVSDTELIITSASSPNIGLAPAVNAKVIKPNSPQNQADYIINLAKSVASRRGAVIWADAPVALDGAGNAFELHPKYIAAEVAALRSITPPQLGLSRKEIKCVSEAPAMYARYKRSLLNSIASNGVMIVSQENEGASVVIRHQLTTDVNNGILAYEDSVGTNVDNLSFQIKDALDKYVGKRNVTPSSLGILRHDVFRILENARTTSIADLEIGPQIINFYDESGQAGKVTVKQHPTFKDRIQVKVKVAIPLPMNVIEVEIEAISEVVVAA